MSTDELTRAQHVDLPAEPVRVAERPLVRAAMLARRPGGRRRAAVVIYPPVAMDILAWGLFAISVDLLLGFTGLLSFGHAAFWGASAYATGLVAIHSGLPFPVASSPARSSRCCSPCRPATWRCAAPASTSRW